MRCVNMHRPSPSVQPRKLPACRSSDTRKGKDPCLRTRWPGVGVFPVWLVQGRKEMCQLSLWPALDLKSWAPVGSGWSSLCCQDRLQIHGHIHSIAVSVKHIWLLISSSWLLVVLSMAVGAQRSWSWQSESFFCGGFIWMKSPPGISFPRRSKLEAKLLDAESSLFSKLWAFWVILMRNKCTEHRRDIWRKGLCLIRQWEGSISAAWSKP